MDNSTDIAKALGQATERASFMGIWGRTPEPFRPGIEKVLGHCINSKNFNGVLYCRELLNSDQLSGRKQGVALGIWELRHAVESWLPGEIELMVNHLIDTELLDPTAFIENDRIVGPLSFFYKYKSREAINAYTKAVTPRPEDATQALLHLFSATRSGSQFDKAVFDLMQSGAGASIDVISPLSPPTFSPRYTDAKSHVMEHAGDFSDASHSTLALLLGEWGRDWHLESGRVHLSKWIKAGGSLNFVFSQIKPHTLPLNAFKEIYKTISYGDMIRAPDVAIKCDQFTEHCDILPKIGVDDAHEMLKDFSTIPFLFGFRHSFSSVDQPLRWLSATLNMIGKICIPGAADDFTQRSGPYKAILTEKIERIHLHADSGKQDKEDAYIQETLTLLDRVVIDINTLATSRDLRARRL